MSLLRNFLVTALVACAVMVGPFARCLADDTEVSAGTYEEIFDRFFDPAESTYTGAVATVVKDGEIVFLKGYGYQDAARTVPVDPKLTRFRLASVTKTLVGVGLGQLIDEGKIESLDDVANRYARRFQLPLNDGTEITLRMLATHQAGFAEKRNAFRYDDDPFQAHTPDYIESVIPEYIRGVNSGAVYSNFGIGALGVILGDQTSAEFHEYVESHIFDKAGMNNSLIAQSPSPVPNLAGAQAFYPDGTTREIPNNWTQNPIIRPAGALVSTGQDMGRFMIGIMGGSSSKDIPDLLSESSRSIVFARQGENHPAAQGYGVVFMHNNWNGFSLFEHGGRSLAARSYLTIVPELKLGIFVSVTGDAGRKIGLFDLLGVVKNPAQTEDYEPPYRAPILSKMRAAYLEPKFGVFDPQFDTSKTVSRDLDEYVGEYRSERRNTRSVSTLFNSILRGGDVITITKDGNGGLVLGYQGPGYIPAGNDIFYRNPQAAEKPSGWNDFFIFTRDENGQIKEGFFQYTDTIFQKRDGLTKPSVLRTMALVSCIVFLTGILAIAWPARFPGKIQAISLPFLVIALPFVYVAFWRSSATEHLGFLTLTANRVIPYQLLTDLLAAVAIYFVYRCLTALRTNPQTGLRAKFAKGHSLVILIAVLPFIWSFWHLGQIGWNIN